MGLYIADLNLVLQACKENSVQHKEILYKNFYGYIKGVMKRYVNDFHSGEELVNDSFIKIFNHLDKFNVNSESADINQSFKSWIAKIASRTAIDFLRKKKMHFQQDGFNEDIIAETTPEWEYPNETKDIFALLNALPKIQKVVFNLYEIDGFSHEEIGRILGISENVSRVYLSRAKNKLKNLYVKQFKETR